MDNTHFPNRKSTRLQGHDYRITGGYFVTICTYLKNPLFGKIVDGLMIPTHAGEIVRYEWFRIPIHRNYVILYEDEFVLMPNHIHAIVWIDDYPSKGNYKNSDNKRLKSGSLGAIIGQYKSKTSRRVNQIRNTPGDTIWQRNYYDHIIRNEKDLRAIRKYLLDNPYK